MADGHVTIALHALHNGLALWMASGVDPAVPVADAMRVGVLGALPWGVHVVAVVGVILVAVGLRRGHAIASG